MNPQFQQLMQDATRFTQSGNLRAATEAIQAALNGTPAPASATAAEARRDDLIIDVDVREVGKPASAPASAHVSEPNVTAQFISGQAHGRDYKLYIPPLAGESPLPLVAMLHGCTQDADDFASGTRMNDAARAAGCFVLYPVQSRKANPQRCWNWFKHSHQVRGRGEAAILAAMTQTIIAQHNIDSKRVYVAGLSAGGAMAAILGDAYPELYAAVGVHSGLSTGSAKDLPSALAAMQHGGAARQGQPSARRTIVFHGDADTTVHPGNGSHVIRASVGTIPASNGETQRGSNFTRQIYRAADGAKMAEHWVVHGSGHAWSGGSRAGTYTDPSGPDATKEMLRFFLE